MTFKPFRVEVHFIFKIHLFEGLIWRWRIRFTLPVRTACQTSPPSVARA